MTSSPDVGRDGDGCLLERLARGGPALELAMAPADRVPLAAQGVNVDGIDFSPSMIAKLRAKPGGGQIAVTLENFADVSVPGAYRLIYVVFNTLFNLLTQNEQVRCFENVAAHLIEDGVFVIEAGVPTEFCRLRNNQYVDLEALAVEQCTSRRGPIRSRHAIARRDPCDPLKQRYTTQSDNHAICMAFRTRSDGAYCGAALEGTLGELGPRAAHSQQQELHIRLRSLSRTPRATAHLAAGRQTTGPVLLLPQTYAAWLAAYIGWNRSRITLMNTDKVFYLSNP